MVRVAFVLIDSRAWTGGYQYQLNLFRALRQYQSEVTPLLFCGCDAQESDILPFQQIPGVEVVLSPVFDRKSRAARLVRSVLLGCDVAALRVFREHAVEVVFENAMFHGWHFPLPTIAWMPDFQHRYLRDHFGFLAYWRRELGFRAQVASGRQVMLSSEDARRDCEHFYRKAANRTSVVRFAAPILPELVEPTPHAVLEKYRLPEVFLYLPNQFWRHKNHAVVIEALGLLKKQGHDVVVAASGNPCDPRHPGYVAELQEKIQALGVGNQFRMLGLIPRQDVISLMRCCAAIINPSRFEGWSSTVEEARAFGVPMLLSAIAVHREQMAADARYFAPADASALAGLILEVTGRGAPMERLVPHNELQVRRFAEDFAVLAGGAAGNGPL